jgi:hypothetical protein
VTLKPTELQQRRERLVARCAELRRTAADAAAPLERKIAAADRLLGALRINPLAGALLVGAGVAIASRLDIGMLARMVSLYALLKRG